MDVTVWNTLTSTPAMRPATSIGRVTITATSRAWRTTPTTAASDTDRTPLKRHGGGVHHAKLRTSEDTSRFQPSTMTNSRILNGSEIIAGGNCSIPIESSVVDTTRSISRNG